MDSGKSSLNQEHNEKADEVNLVSDQEEPLTPGNKGKRKESPAGETSKPPKVNKTLKTRASVWSHFTRTKNDRDKCNCNYCQKVLACPTRSGTSALTTHLRTCKEHQAWKNGQGRTQTVINGDGEAVVAKIPESVIREAANEMLVIGELPLSFIESMAWKHFCNKVNLYKPHSRRTATRDIVKMYARKKDSLMNIVLCNEQRVSLTTDIWVSETTGASYMVVTCHFIDANWRLQKLIIGFKYVSDHKGQTICSVLIDVLAEWGIKKVFCVTVDNATANTSALRRFHHEFSLGASDAFVLDGNYMHMRCCAHIINLVAREGLHDLRNNIAAIRNAITYVRASTNRLKDFELKVDRGRLSRGSLPMDVKTRWNSTFLMLSRAIQFRIAFDKMELEDRLYNDYFLEHENGIKRLGPPTKTDWDAAERLVNFLVIFYNSTMIVSASSTVNSHKCYCEIVVIERNLTALVNSMDPELKVKAREMLEKFHKYWDGIKNINKMLVIASVFDPRHKLGFAKLCFERLYGKDTPECLAMYESVYELLYALFREYSSRSTRTAAPYDVPSSQASQSNQASTSNSQDQVSDRMELVYGNFGYERIDLVYNELLKENGVEDPRDEMEKYLKEPVEVPKVMLGTEWDILSWWKQNKDKYPILSEMAKDLLAMQVTSVASESAFSTSGRILDPYRSCLTHFHIEVLMCTEQWLKADMQFKETVITNDQMLADIEMLDNLQKMFEETHMADD